MTDKATDGPSHDKLLRQFEEAFEQTKQERQDAEQCRDYYDGYQLTDDELEALRQRKQPPVISNRIKPKVDALVGFYKRQRKDPKAFPRTPQHQQDADSATDALRYVCDANRFPAISSEAAENLFVEGAGAGTVGVRQRANGQFEVTMTPVPWDRFYRDPHSRKRDFSDASYMGVVLWMDEDEAKALGGAEVVAGCYDAGTEGETYEDRPKVIWADKGRKRVRVFQHRWKEGGVWHTAIVCKGGFLRKPQPSPYLDEDGQPENDLIAVSAYVDRENRRYGAVKAMISPQDEINKRRSKALHLLNTRQIITEEGAVTDLEQARREAARPDGVMVVMPGMRFELAEQMSLVSGQFELLQESKAEIDASGVNPAIEGDLKAPSGRAQELITQAGLAEQAVAFDAMKDWTWRMYKAAWNRIRQYWTDERWIRVTDDPRNTRWVQLQPGQLSQTEVDLIIEDGPDSVSIQAEQFDKLVELKKADPTAIPTAAIIEASDLRNKDKLLEHLEQGGIPPQVAQQMQEMQQALADCQQQLQQAQQEAVEARGDTAIKAAELQLKERELALKEAELQLKVYEAETDRIQALKPDPQPQNKDV